MARVSQVYWNRIIIYKVYTCVTQYPCVLIRPVVIEKAFTARVIFSIRSDETVRLSSEGHIYITSGYCVYCVCTRLYLMKNNYSHP